MPRAGEWANAFYDRGTRSLQFFSFPDGAGNRVYTGLSRDIVSHECGHALLDAVVPSLYDSSTPQSVAIHEAVADLVAVIMALDSARLRQAVLALSGNSLSGPNAFNNIAEEFGMARPGADGMGRTALRALQNDSTLETLAGERPHVLSTLLSAIFYDTLCTIFTVRFEDEQWSDDAGVALPTDEAANKALGTALIIFRRFLLRGIDYLPPGELSFADVGRATLGGRPCGPARRRLSEALIEQRRSFAESFVTAVDRGRGRLPRLCETRGPRRPRRTGGPAARQRLGGPRVRHPAPLDAGDPRRTLLRRCCPVWTARR